jgi:hypothetical protein
MLTPEESGEKCNCSEDDGLKEECVVAMAIAIVAPHDLG